MLVPPTEQNYRAGPLAGVTKQPKLVDHLEEFGDLGLS